MAWHACNLLLGSSREFPGMHAAHGVLFAPMKPHGLGRTLLELNSTHLARDLSCYTVVLFMTNEGILLFTSPRLDQRPLAIYYADTNFGGFCF